jgi:hypothetical protein
MDAWSKTGQNWSKLGQNWSKRVKRQRRCNSRREGQHGTEPGPGQIMVK